MFGVMGPVRGQLSGTRDAIGGSMIDIALTLLALVAGGFTIEMYTVAGAPFGDDEVAEFGLGDELLRLGDDFQCENPS
jgi:hypothetical protein